MSNAAKPIENTVYHTDAAFPVYTFPRNPVTSPPFPSTFDRYIPWRRQMIVVSHHTL